MVKIQDIGKFETEEELIGYCRQLSYDDMNELRDTTSSMVLHIQRGMSFCGGDALMHVEDTGNEIVARALYSIEENISFWVRKRYEFWVVIDQCYREKEKVKGIVDKRNRGKTLGDITGGA